MLGREGGASSIMFDFVRTDTDFLAAALSDATLPVLAACREARLPLVEGAKADDLADGIRQLIQVITRADADSAHGERLSGGDISDIGEYGAGLLQLLMRCAGQLDLPDARHAIGRTLVPLSLWVARNGGTLSVLDPLVDALAELANQCSDVLALSRLAEVFGELVDAVAPTLCADLDQGNPGRPWRVLHLNYGIVATRSHEPQLMAAAFDRLIHYFPDDAAGFFAEGMRQMDALDYPGHVRAVMEQYYKRFSEQRVH